MRACTPRSSPTINTSAAAVPSGILERLRSFTISALRSGIMRKTPSSPADHRDRRDLRPRQVVAEQEERGQREDDSGGDGFAGGARRLHHVVLQDRRGLRAERRARCSGRS